MLDYVSKWVTCIPSPRCQPWTGLFFAIIISDAITCQHHQLPEASEIWIPEQESVFIKQGSVAGNIPALWCIKAAQTTSGNKSTIKGCEFFSLLLVSLRFDWLLFHCLQYPVSYQIYMAHKFQPVDCLQMADCDNFGLNRFYSHEYSIIWFFFYIILFSFLSGLHNTLKWLCFLSYLLLFYTQTWICTQKCIFLNKFPCINMCAGEGGAN